MDEYLPEQTGENIALLQLAVEPVDFDKDEDQEPSLAGTEDFTLDTETGGEFWFELQNCIQIYIYARLQNFRKHCWLCHVCLPTWNDSAPCE